MGTPLTNLFSASCKDGILQDLALQLTRFYTRYRSFKHDKLPALTLSSRSALSEEEIDRFAHQIRQTIDHRKIHYPLCYLGVLCMLVPLLFGRMARKGLRNALQKPQTLPSFVVLLLCAVATVNCFTSYSLIVLPSSNALLLSLSICFYFLLKKQSMWSCFRLVLYLFISCFRSGSRFFTASLFFLAMVFTSFKNKWLILIQIVLECWYLCCSPSPFLAWSAFFLCFFQSFSASSLLSLFVLLAFAFLDSTLPPLHLFGDSQLFIFEYSLVFCLCLHTPHQYGHPGTLCRLHDVLPLCNHLSNTSQGKCARGSHAHRAIECDFLTHQYSESRCLVRVHSPVLVHLCSLVRSFPAFGCLFNPNFCYGSGKYPYRILRHQSLLQK